MEVVSVRTSREVPARQSRHAEVLQDVVQSQTCKKLMEVHHDIVIIIRLLKKSVMILCSNTAGKSRFGSPDSSVMMVLRYRIRLFRKQACNSATLSGVGPGLPDILLPHSAVTPLM